MPYVRVQPEDIGQVQAVADLWNAARLVDDPDAVQQYPG